MRWSPDTCKCVFDFEPDPNDDSNQILTDVVKRCDDHKGLSGSNLHQVVLKQENQHKNKLHAQLLQLDDMAEEVTKNGTTSRQFKEGCGFDWSFTGKDGARVLSIETKGHVLTDKQKTDLASFSIAEVGADKVAIQ